MLPGQLRRATQRNTHAFESLLTGSQSAKIHRPEIQREGQQEDSGQEQPSCRGADNNESSIVCPSPGSWLLQLKD